MPSSASITHYYKILLSKVYIFTLLDALTIYYEMMKILFIGDVVGSPGRKMVQQYLPALKESYRPSIVKLNGENAAGGKGITEKIYKQFLNWGVHVVTMGNHTWDKREIFDFIDDAKRLV